MADSPLTGILLWFNPEKGFGMIRPDNLLEDDVMCPVHAMQGDAQDYVEGAIVNYFVEQQLVGMVATSVWIADKGQ
jgi:cold shock CspA family protein